MFCIIAGILLLFTMCCGFCTAMKRICFFHYLFAIMITIFTLFFLVLGILLISIAVISSNKLDELCSSVNSNSDIQKAMKELYLRADTFYCAASWGCYIGPVNWVNGKTNASTTDSSLNTNVQGCKAQIEAAYANYGVSFNDINDIITYLDLFGKIESEYSCSGIWIKQTVYYFSDSSKGKIHEFLFINKIIIRIFLIIFRRTKKKMQGIYWPRTFKETNSSHGNWIYYYWNSAFYCVFHSIWVMLQEKQKWTSEGAEEAFSPQEK